MRSSNSRRKSQTRVIQNFGLFWERRCIDWGKRGAGNLGALNGFTSKPSSPVDFRMQRGIYVLYEGESIASQRVTYVGQAGAGTNDLFHRLRSHRDDHLWNRWQRFSWLGFLSVGNNRRLVHQNKAAVGLVGFSTALNQIEAVLISLLEPLHNRQGAKWHGATEYFQVQIDTANPKVASLSK